MDLILKEINKDKDIPELAQWKRQELLYLKNNPKEGDKLLGIKRALKGRRIKNPASSVIAYLIDITDEKPTSYVRTSSTTLPDIDYDTDARDQIKKYLAQKYGKDKVALLGTFNTLKVKGALKDILRVKRPEITSDEVNKLTKKFDVLNQLEFSSQLDFFNASLEADPTLKGWFLQNKDIHDILILTLGNIRSTGIHAGGVVVSSEPINQIVPTTYNKDYEMDITQYEMGFVEQCGLVKYDFLGLNTLADINRALKHIKKLGVNLKLKDIPLDETKILEQFKLGNTTSVFQFNTDLAVSILTQLKEVSGVRDLALITAIARPGPLNMGMDKIFIARKNGYEPISYLHPSLEPILKETYGIIVFQEQIQKIVQELAGFSGDESLSIMKAMSKKIREKVLKFQEQFIERAKAKGIGEQVAKKIWDLMESFSEYGFNKSHSVAYAILSYYCMWLKENYPPQWIAGVLEGADKEDFKIFYSKWSKMIKKPSIINSSTSYEIVGGRAVMPLSAVNGIAEKAVGAIAELGEIKSFEDFVQRADKRRVNKTTVLSLIFSGCFDDFREGKEHSQYRKDLISQYLEYRAKVLKVPKKDREEEAKLNEEIQRYTQGVMLREELSRLNFSAFDYHIFFAEQMTTKAKRLFGMSAKRPIEASKEKSGKTVVVGGGVEEINFFVVKSGNNRGKEMAKIRISSLGGSIEITVFPNTLEDNDLSGKSIRKLKEFTPIIVKGKLNEWNGSKSVIYEEGWSLI